MSLQSLKLCDLHLIFNIKGLINEQYLDLRPKITIYQSQILNPKYYDTPSP